MNIKLFIILLILSLCVASVSAWEIKSDKYVGTVSLYGDGTGSIEIIDHGYAEFTWNAIGDNQYEAHYWFYTVPFTYHPETDTITSTMTDAILVR